MNQFMINRHVIKLFTIVFILFSLLAMIPGHASGAPQASGIKVEASVGFQGHMKQGEWYPVRLTVTNQTDSPLDGELVISVLSNNGGYTTDYVLPAQLPQQTAVQLTVAIPGDTVDKKSSKIRFFKGSFASGKEIAIIGNDYIEAKVTNSYTIGVISRDPDTLNFMPSLNQRGYDIMVIPISEKELPEEAVMLKMFNTIVINDAAASGWTEGQINSIKDWVKLGGTLILSGGAGYGKTADAFQDITPVASGGTTELSATSALESYGGTAIKLDAPLTVSTGKLTEGQIDLAEDGLILAASRKVGFGTVKYVAFDPSLAPMSTWSGSAVFWSKLMQNSLTPLQPGMMLNGSDNLYWNMQHLIDQFPSIKQPSFMLLLLMFVGYMIIVAPVLYLILAKTDRREWAWWIIPALSVLMGIAVFFFGAEDKNTMSAHTIEIIELSGQGDAVRSGATGIFVPAGGTVKAKFQEHINAISYSSDYQSSLALDGKTQFILEDGASSALWRSVPYWSTRKLWMDHQLTKDAVGKLTLSYKENNGTITLSVQNDTITDLSQVSLLMNGQVYLIGDLNQGARGSTKFTAASNSHPGYYSYGHNMFPNPTGRYNDGFNRHRELIDSYMNTKFNGLTAAYPVIIGFSTDQESTYTVNGNQVKADNLKLWSQQLESLWLTDNRVIIPNGLVKPVVASSTLVRMDNYGDGMISAGIGELVVDYMIPNSYEVIYDKLDITMTNNHAPQNSALTVWNEKKGEWTEPVEASASPQDYMIQNQILRMKITVTADTEFSLPQIALEGEVRNR